jgi:diacylglycerol kinase family enzyme
VEGESERRRLLLVFANGRWFGGAFHIAPTASVDDGVLDMVGVADAGPLTRLRLFAAVMGGRHLSLSAVEHRRAASFTLRFPAPPNAQIDGELVRLTATDVTVACLPAALRVVAVNG